MASMIAAAMFAGIQFAFALPPEVDLYNADYLPALNPEFICTPYNPELPPGRTYLNVSVYVKNIVGLSMWDIMVKWDPVYLKCYTVVFNPPGGPIGGMPESEGNWYATGDSVFLGQAKTTPGGVNLPANVLAWVILEVKYPGKSLIWIDDTSVLPPYGFFDDEYHNLNVAISYPDASWQSHTPVPVWSHNATAHTLPSKECKVDCHTVTFGDYVMFNGTVSWSPDQNPIVSYEWFYGDGYYSNDIRLTNFKNQLPIGRMEDQYLRPAGLVLPGDLDIGTPLVPFLQEETHVDNGNLLYDMPEPICWDNDTDLVFNATMGDYVIFPPQGIVPDGTPLVNFATTTGCGHEWPREKHCDNEYQDGKYTAFEEIYEDRDGPHDEGYSHVTAGAMIMLHQYLDYRQEAYHAWLGVMDSTGLYWRSDWYEQKPEHDIWIWRDVSISDIWPSLDLLDNVHYWWNWAALQNEEYALGKYGLFNVALVNTGSISEYVHVELFAIRVQLVAGFSAGEYVMDGSAEVYMIEEWLYQQGPNSGSGFMLAACWTPPKKGVYILVAKVDVLPCTHEGIGAKIDDFYGMSWWTDGWGNGPNTWTEWADPSSNNLYVMPKPLFVFDSAEEYNRWYCDIDKDPSTAIFVDELDLWGRVWFTQHGVPP
jgi:hypothetical protein